MRDGVELLTSVHRNMNDDVKPNDELYGGERIQDACDPLVLPRYRVSSVAVRVSERISILDERHQPLSQDELGSGRNRRVVQGFNERRFFAPVIPWSKTPIPSVGISHVHLFAVMVSLLGGVSRQEPNVPRLCSPDQMTLRTEVVVNGLDDGGIEHHSPTFTQIRNGTGKYLV